MISEDKKEYFIDGNYYYEGNIIKIISSNDTTVNEIYVDSVLQKVNKKVKKNNSKIKIKK